MKGKFTLVYWKNILPRKRTGNKVVDEILDRFKNRRKMAWLSLISIIVITLLACFLVPFDRLSILENLLSWFYTVMTSIVMSYMGAATVEYFKKAEPKTEIKNNETTEQ